MEVLNVAADLEELVVLALADVLQSEMNDIEYSTKYFPKRESLLVSFAHQQDKEKLRHVVKQVKVDDVVYEVKWTKMDVCPSGDQACPGNVVEVLCVTDQDLVCEYFKDVLGNQPQYSFEEKRNLLTLYLSDAELLRILEDERPCIDEHGPVHVVPAFDSHPDQKYRLEILGVTDEDIVMEYILNCIKRSPDYQYFKETSRIILNLLSQGECDRLLSKSVHYIDDLEQEVTFRKLLLPSKALKVCGIPNDVSEKYLNAYFKKDKNGGGPIKKLQWDSANGVAIVSYNEDEVAERVFKKDHHKIRNAVLTVDIIEDLFLDAPKSIAASPPHGAADLPVTTCLVVSSSCRSADEIRNNIRNSWQLHDGEYKLQFNLSEGLAIVRITTTTGKLRQVLTHPLKNGEVVEKCDDETQSLLGDVHVLIEKISDETSREAVWSWLKVVTRCAAHTIYYSDVLSDKSITAVALISFNEDLTHDMSFKSALHSEYSMDKRILSTKLIRSPLNLMYVGTTKKGESAIKQELQDFLDQDNDNPGSVNDVELVNDRAIAYLSSKKDIRHFVRPRLIVTVAGGKIKEVTLRKFFADRSASGGDKTAKLRSNADGSYDVTFDDPEAADRVLQKYENEGLQLGPSSLSVYVRGMREMPHSSKDQVLVRNIGTASEDSIKYLLRALADSDNVHLTFVRDPRDDTLCALARFPKTIDRYRLAYCCEAASLDCKQLEIDPVPLQTAVILQNVPSDADKQMVKYCFDPEYVKDCTEQENGKWIVYFTDHIYAEKVLDSKILYDNTLELFAELHSEFRVDSDARKEGKRGLYQIRCEWASFNIVGFVQKSKQQDFDRLLKETKVECDCSEDGLLIIRLSGAFTEDDARAIEGKFRSFLNNYDYHLIDVLPDLWSELLNSQELAEIQRLEQSILHVVLSNADHDNKSCSIALTGQSSAVQNARQKVDQAITFISDERKRQKQRTSHLEELNPWVAKFLVANDVTRKLLDQQKDLFIAIDESRGTCRLDGYPSNIQRALDHISSIVASIAQESFDVSLEVSKFLEMESIASHINAKLLLENLIPCTLWFLPRACLVNVYGLQAEQLRKAVQVIRGEIFENDMNFGDTMESVIGTEKWRDCKDAICGRRGGDVIIAEDPKVGLLHIVCKACDSPAVLEEINNFTRRNLIKQIFFKVPRLVMKLASSIFSREIKDLEKIQSRNHVRLSPTLSKHGEYGFCIEGNEDGCVNIQRIINDFLYKQQKVVTKQHVVRQPGAARFFIGHPSALQTIGTKSNTYIEVHDPNYVLDSRNEDSSCEFKLPGGVLVAVKKANIIDLECDAIVNPSNGELQHSGGLAAIIAVQGGDELVKECEEYIRQNKSLPEGQACITGPGKGKLRCKKVIHAVGPRWQGGNRSEVNKLFQAVQNSLFCAEKNNLASVALPPISSGIFRFPLELCTSTIVDSVVDYCEQKKGSLAQVLLVDVNDDGVMHFRRALNRRLGNESTPDHTESRHRSSNQSTNKEMTDVRTQLSGPDFCGKVRQGLTSVLGDISVEILREDICSQQVDVIVSTIGQDLDFSKGILSKLILKAAGNKMEQELKKCAAPVAMGYIAVTSGYRLKCQKVYHVCCPQFDPSQGAEQINKIALRILMQANEEQLSSIAMPAIGTGNLGHPPESVAGQLFRAVRSFAQSTRNPVLKKVKFVLIDTLYEVFRDLHSKFLTDVNAKLSNDSTGRQAAFLHEESAATATIDYKNVGAEIDSLDDVDNLDDVDATGSDTVLNICGSETNINTAILQIEELCNSELRSRFVSDEPSVIAQLSELEVKKYNQFGKLVGVSVDVQHSRKVIILKSMDDSALSKVNEGILWSLKSRQVAYLGKKEMDLEKDYWQIVEEQCFKQAQWQYRSLTEPKWCNYPKVINKKLEESFSKRQPNCIYGPPSNRFAVDLVSFVDSSDKKADAEVTVRRRDPRKPWPEEWDSTEEKYYEVLLDTKCFEFKDVENEFVSALGGIKTKILQITRVQNASLYLQYAEQKERVKSSMASNNPIERRLWFGTSEAAMKVICLGGFNRSRDGSSDLSFGEGVYFAKSSGKACQDSGCKPNALDERFVILAMVLTGDFEVGQPKMRTPTMKASGSLYSNDTTVDDIDDPTVFVTFHDSQAYPAYVIKFK